MITVTVGIPAYNEANNIASVLQQVLKQHATALWKLDEIIVISDGSSDDTVKNARKVKSSKITVFDHRERKGKTARLSELFRIISGDILIMFDADITLDDNHVITRLVQAFDNRSVALVGGNSHPYLPNSFFQRAVYSTYEVFYNSRIMLKNGNNVFGCTGSILAIRSSLAKSISLPKIINEDAYLYLYCLQLGYHFKYVDTAKISYKLPANISDYIRQVLRSDPISVTNELEKKFGELARSEFKRPRIFYLHAILKVFIHTPLETLFIILLNIMCRPFLGIILHDYRLDWFTAKSTK